MVSRRRVTLSTASAADLRRRNVGTGKTVTVSGLTIGGADAGNYTLTQPTTTANITAKALTVSGITADAGQSKVFGEPTGSDLHLHR